MGKIIPLNFSAQLMLILCLLIVFTGCAGHQRQIIDTDNTMMIEMGKSIEDPVILEKLSLLENLQYRGADIDPFVIRVPKGFSLPVHMKVETPMARLNSQCSPLVFDRDVFLYVSSDGMLISPDKRVWASFSDMEAVKDLFGGGNGQLSVGLSAEKGDKALLSVTLKVYPKSK